MLKSTKANEKLRIDNFSDSGELELSAGSGVNKSCVKIQGAYNYPEKTEKIVLDEPLLYNLNNDPSEKFDIAKDNPQILKNIEEVIINYKKDIIFKEDLLKYRSVE